MFKQQQWHTQSMYICQNVKLFSVTHDEKLGLAFVPCSQVQVLIAIFHGKKETKKRYEPIRTQ